jgi:hypothetical protein
VDHGSAERIGKNEAIFRDINERIEAGRLPAEVSRRVPFCCECARLGCNELISVTIGAYETVRANPRRFLLAVGHEIDGAERVVETNAAYIVVEKTGEAGATAAGADPR